MTRQKGPTAGLRDVRAGPGLRVEKPRTSRLERLPASLERATVGFQEVMGASKAIPGKLLDCAGARYVARYGTVTRNVPET